MSENTISLDVFKASGHKGGSKTALRGRDFYIGIGKAGSDKRWNRKPGQKLKRPAVGKIRMPAKEEAGEPARGKVGAVLDMKKTDENRSENVAA